MTMKNIFDRLVGRHKPAGSNHQSVADEQASNQEPSIRENPAAKNDGAVAAVGPERAVSLLDAIPDVVPNHIDLEQLKSGLDSFARSAAGRLGVLAFAGDVAIVDSWPTFDECHKVKLSYTLAGRKIGATVELLKHGSIHSYPLPWMSDVKLAHVKERQGQILCRITWKFTPSDGMTVEYVGGREKPDPLEFNETVVVVAYHAKKGVFEVRMPNSDVPFFLLRDLVERDLPGLGDRIPVS